MVKTTSIIQACRPLMKQGNAAFKAGKFVPSASTHSIHTFSSTPCACASCTSNVWNGKSMEINNTYNKLRPEQKNYSTTASASNKHVQKILDNNKKWVDSVNAKDPTFFPTLGKGQAPKYLYFGCSDSRVPANQIMGLGPGEVFVHRNIGNQVPGNDLNALSVLEYAVGHLGVTDIIVTGHLECGAVKAATSRQDLGTLENWLRLIRDVYRLNRKELDAIPDLIERQKRLIELNVIEQAINVYKVGVVQRKRIESRNKLLALPENKGKTAKDVEDEVYPRIHGFVFNPSEGILRKLPVNFEERVGSLDQIYGLYGPSA